MLRRRWRLLVRLALVGALVGYGASGGVRAGGACGKGEETTTRRISDLAKAADPGKTVEGVQARTELEKLSTSLEEAMTKLDQTDPASSVAGMVVMGSAARPTGEAPPT